MHEKLTSMQIIKIQHSTCIEVCAIFDKMNTEYLHDITSLFELEFFLKLHNLKIVEKTNQRNPAKYILINHYTVNSEIFARVLFSRNFAYAKFRENIALTKG